MSTFKDLINCYKLLIDYYILVSIYNRFIFFSYSLSLKCKWFISIFPLWILGKSIEWFFFKELCFIWKYVSISMSFEWDVKPMLRVYETSRLLHVKGPFQQLPRVVNKWPVVRQNYFLPDSATSIHKWQSKMFGSGQKLI